MNLLLLTISLILIIAFVLKVKKRRDIARKIQGPASIPLLGYAKIFWVSFEELMPLLNDLQKQFQNYYKLWIGPELWVVVYDPKLAEKILVDQNLVKSNDYKFLKPWLGNGLLTNEGKNWFSKRKAITSAFHFKILENYIEVFERQSEVLLEKFNTKEIIDVTPHLLLCAFDIISETSMGFEMNAQRQSTSEYVKAIHRISEICYKRMFNPFLQPDWVFWFLKDSKVLSESLQFVDKKTQELINQRREILRQQNADKDPTLEKAFGQKTKKALLDTLLTANVDGKPFTDQEIRDEVNTFLFAGHDTTGSTLSFLLYNIAKYPEVQNKLIDEIHSLFYDNGAVTITKLNEMKYLELVIKESMRIFTTVPFISRQILKNYQIDNLEIPENTNLSIYIYGMCHREDLFPNAEKFLPERFDVAQNAEDFNPFSYIPFAAGHRNCIGQKFALLELKTIIVKILEKYEIQLGYPEKELVLLAGMILKSKDGINLKFKLRNKKN